MYRNKKGEFASKADKRLQRKIALAQARQVWQWSVCIIILGAFPVLEIKDRLNKEYVFENPSAAAAQVGNGKAQAQDQSHERSEEEAQMEDGTSRGKQAKAPVVSETEGDTHTFHPVTPETIEAKILEAFNGDKVALAVAKGESGLDPNAKGYNCKYGSRSTSCKPEDREKAWSVDCGIYQINTVAKDCPTHLMDPETNIAIAKEMQSKRGWSPWVAYWNGQYKNHLN